MKVIKTVKKWKYGNLLFIIVGFTLLFALMVFLQGCATGSEHSENNSGTVNASTPELRDTTIILNHPEWRKYFGEFQFKQSGMHYSVVTLKSGNDFHVINITRDSLESAFFKDIMNNPRKYYG